MAPSRTGTTALVGGLLAAGALTLGVSAGSADARGLTRFGNCTDLRGWFVSHTVGDVGPYGWGGEAIPMLDAAGSSPSTAAGGTPSERAVGSSATGTNTQEAGVDEPDLAKTDGRLVVRLQHGRDVVITDVTGRQPREVGRYSLGGAGIGSGLLLVGQHVLVATSPPAWPGPAKGAPPTDTPSPGPALEPGILPVAGTRLLDLDIGDPSRPRLVADHSYDGEQVSLQQQGTIIRMVLRSGRPALPFTSPAQTRDPDAATRYNRALVEHTTVRDWLPTVTDDLRGGTRPLLTCDAVLHPRRFAGTDITTVVGYDARHPDRLSSTAVVGNAETVYSSRDRLYVAATRYPQLPGPVPAPWAGSAEGFVPTATSSTDLHAFALRGTGATYLGSGHLDGTVRDRWSLDEYAGHLRVALTRPDRRGRGQDNSIVVLGEKDGRLVPTGEVGGLGRDESIQAVRWFDGLAVLVTFRQVDPLYTVDLTDPAHPRALGALRLTGYSGYLHPIGDHRLLGLGVDATGLGQRIGAQAAVFDISDPRHPRRLGREVLGPWTDLGAVADPHQFAWLPASAAAVTTLRDGSPEPRQVLLRVGPDGSLSSTTLPDAGGDDRRALPLPDGRVALTGETVLVVDPAR